MNKALKFTPHLVPLVLSGEKTSTWRLWDDKDLSLDDTLDLINSQTKEVFAKAKITKLVVKKMGEIIPEDKEGHEAFKNDEEMYKAYSRYYAKDVTSKTQVKILWFKMM